MKNCVKNFNEYAQNLLITFVHHFGQLYGNDMIVYNVHGLIHLADDAKTFKSLENISEFPFENLLASLKNMVRKPEFLMAQIIRRLSEKADTNIEKKSVSKNCQNNTIMDHLPNV